jgi:hypothetical protein
MSFTKKAVWLGVLIAILAASVIAGWVTLKRLDRQHFLVFDRRK